MKFSRKQQQQQQRTSSLVPSLLRWRSPNSTWGNTNAHASTNSNKSNMQRRIMYILMGVWCMYMMVTMMFGMGSSGTEDEIEPGWVDWIHSFLVNKNHHDYVLPLTVATAGKPFLDEENAHPNLDNYEDCKGQSFAELLNHFDEFGYVIFLPCSLTTSMGGDALMDDIIHYIDEVLPSDGASGGRIQDGNHKSIIELGGNDEIRTVVNGLYRDQSGAAFPFQTLNFKYGTEQKQHSDLIHFSGFPNMAMAAAWIALEDIHQDSGPLLFYPKSNHLPFQDMKTLNCPQGNYTCYEYAIEQYIKQQQQQPQQSFALEPKIAYPMSKGEVLIWSSNLFHGGTQRNNPSPTMTRYSQVTHYLFEGNAFYGGSLYNNLDKQQYLPIPFIPSYPQAYSLIQRYWRPSSPWFYGYHFAKSGKMYFRPEIFHDLQGNDLNKRCPFQRS